jgi:hypothetical protein
MEKYPETVLLMVLSIRSYLTATAFPKKMFKQDENCTIIYER